MIFQFNSLMRVCAISGLLALAACGGNNSSSVASAGASGDVTLSGIAAVGAPIVGGAITLKCSTAVNLGPITTSATGAWSASLASSALPCALSVNGGTVGGLNNSQSFHSLALAAGTVNLTPLTDLILANATGMSPGAWFSSITVAQLTAAQSAISSAQSKVLSALGAAGYSVPNNLQPFTTSFSASAQDTYDNLLDAIGKALSASNSSFASLAAQWAAAGSTSLVAPPSTSGSGSTTGATTSSGTGLGLTGTPTLLGSEDGASATINGIPYTFKGAASWFDLTRVFVAASRTGTTVDPLKSWSIRLLPAAIGSYSCATTNGLTIQLQNSGLTASTSPTGGACQIEVTAVTSATITGRFSATLVNGLTGSVFGSTTDGYFRIATTTGTPVASGSNGVSFDVAGTTYSYSNVFDFGFEIFSGLVGSPSQNTSPGFPQGIQIHTVPSTLGTYPCVQGVSYRDLNIWFYWNSKWYYAGNRQTLAAPLPAAAQCTVTVTSLQDANRKGTFAGTFSGTFYADDGSSISVSNGNFTLIVP
jgi:hypothetical protein